MSLVGVRIVGLDDALRAISPEELSKGIPAGLYAVGQAVSKEVHGYIKPHHYTGRAEQQVHAEPPVGSGFNAHVFVGTSANLVPELRPLMFGWPGGQGKRPPIDAIARWLASKPELANSSNVTRNAQGFVRRRGTIATISQDKALRSRAFLIARAIGRRGYTFGSGQGGQHIKTFEDAWLAVRGQAAGIILRQIRRTS